MFLLRFHSNRFASPNSKGAGLRARHRSGRTWNPNRSRDRKGAFAGHAPSQRSLTVAALPEVRCTPGFSGLARTSVKRLTFKSRAPGLFDALSSHAQATGAGVGKERGAHELVHVAGEVGEVYVGDAREVAGDLGEEFAGEQAERGAFERTVIDVTVAAGRDVREQPDSHRGRYLNLRSEEHTSELQSRQYL